MAKDFSFDVVSEVSLNEVSNAVDQARREITTRYDFKDTETSVSLADDLIEVRANSEHRVQAAVEVVKEKMVRRQVSLKALHEGPVLPGAKSSFKQTINVNHGINDEKAREVTKFVKGLPGKVQSQIMGEQVRITGKKKDDLQSVMQALKEKDFGIPLQFTNFRP
jgi:uncharacterized protein YajQ (UPF0234 family)